MKDEGSTRSSKDQGLAVDGKQTDYGSTNPTPEMELKWKWIQDPHP